MAARRGVWLVLTLIAIAVVISMAGVLMSVLFFSRGPSIPAKTTLVFNLPADLPEVETGGLFGQWLEERPSVRELVEALRRAKTDSRITGLVLSPSGGSPFWAKVQEIRDAVLDFRTSGKKTVAFLEYGGEQEYYLASACDRILLVPTAVLDLKGLANYEVFFRGTLDKIGTVPDLLHIGDYKTAINIFTEKGFTPAHREMTESLNNDTFEHLVEGIAKTRKQSVDQVRGLIDQGPFLPEDALRAGLVDDLAYRDELEAQTGLSEDETTDLEAYARAAPALGGFRRRSRVALIYAVGTIVSGKSQWSADGPSVGSDTLVEYIEEAREDDSIDAIVLRVDSPGGSSIASDVIWRALMLARDEKPLVVSMSDLAASGGYYLAMAGHSIVAQPGTLTGSIGIFSGKFVTAGTFGKLGANVDAVSRGRFAQMDSPIRPFNPDERAKVEEQMQAFYDQFVEKVAQARKSSPEKIDAIAQGRVWTGRQARSLGLVDELGGLARAFALARQRAKIPDGETIDIVVYPPKKSFLETVAKPFGQLEESRIRAALSLLPPAERRLLSDLAAPVRLLRSGEPLALMPFVFLR